MAWSLNELRNPALRKFFGKIFGDVNATAAKKVTIEAEDETAGISKIEQGSLTVPQVLNANPGSTIVGKVLNILHSAGAGDCDDCYGTYEKVAVTGDGDAGLTVVGGSQRCYVGTSESETVAKEAYGDQPWAKKEGTGGITAMSALSAKTDVSADNFTVVNTINAGHFHTEGAATVTGQFDGVMIEAYGDVTSQDSMLHLQNDSAAGVSAMIQIDGSTTDFLKFTESGDGGAVTSDPTVGDANTWIKCHIGDTIFWLVGYADS